MNLVDAAIEILRGRPGTALSAEDLANLANEQGLVDKPSTPSSMKGRLATELKKGDGSRVERTEEDLYRLREGGVADAGVVAEAGQAEADLDGQEQALGDDEAFEDDDDDDLDDDDDDDDLDEDEDELDDDFDDDDEDSGDHATAEAVEVAIEETATPPAPDRLDSIEEAEEEEEEQLEGGAPPIDDGPPPELDPRLEDVLAPPMRAMRMPTAPTEPGDEQAMVLYGEEVEEKAGLAVTEYEDDKTADEDRPMMPEISAGRRRERGRDRDRRSRRDERRAEREARRRDRGAARGPRTGGGEAAAAPSAAPAAALPSGPPPADDLAAAAAFTLAEMRDGQPVQVKQLAQMMRKRRLFNGDPERLWPHLRAALIHDERSHRSRGLRPRVVGRGRDLFSLPAAKLDAGLADAEAALARATLALEQSTRRALTEKLGQVSLPVLEQVAHVWLIHAGYRDIDWIKRVDRSAYGSAQSPDIGAVLVGVRAGEQPVDRRGVGELRAGVAAKGLGAGLLLSARPLSTEALAELEKPGKPVISLCGEALASALIGARIGVQTAAVPVVYLDADYFEELSRG